MLMNFGSCCCSLKREKLFLLAAHGGAFLSAVVNPEADTALHILQRMQHRLMPATDSEIQPGTSMEVPPELEALLEDAHDLKCPITLELLMDPCILDGKVYFFSVS